MKKQILITGLVSSVVAIVIAVAAFISVPHFVERELDRREAELVAEFAPFSVAMAADLGMGTAPPPKTVRELLQPLLKMLEIMESMNE